MLMALLGEMHRTSLASDSWVHLPRAGGVAYAAQESWVLSETIKVCLLNSLYFLASDGSTKDNILFGSPYNEERYKKGEILGVVSV